jgi:hypothetical protein
MHKQLSLLDWRPPITSSVPVVIHKPELCARCDILGKAMCTHCKNAEEEREKESNKPMTPEEMKQFFSQSSTWSSLHPR